MGRLCHQSALVAVIYLTLVGWGWGIEDAAVSGPFAPQAENSKVEAMYVFGDSTVENGNNNHLRTISRANYPPYGRDFDNGTATGRFTNGRMTADWIAEFLRIPTPPPYLSPDSEALSCQGANFASAGAGIMNNTGRVLGEILSGWQQIELFLQRRKHLIADMGEEATKQHLRDSLFYFATGGNDFIHSWILHDTDATVLPLNDFTSLLATTVEAQLQVLYNAGARRAAVVSIGPVGCAPHFLWLSRTVTGTCMQPVNQYISRFNAVVRAMLLRFNRKNPGAHFEYRDIWDIVYRLATFPREYGFLNGNTACCGGGGNYRGGASCGSPLQVCANPAGYVWWDEYHPSHQANYVISRQIFSGPDPFTSTDRQNSSTHDSFLTIEQLASLDLELGLH